jgi:hypothetical protein
LDFFNEILFLTNPTLHRQKKATRSSLAVIRDGTGALLLLVHQIQL